MTKTLSAAGSSTSKYFLLAAALFVFGDVILIVWSGAGMPSPQAIVTLLLVFLVPLAAVALVPEPYKRVRMTNIGIYVSDNKREIFVPFSAIESASRERTDESTVIGVTFRVPTEFGDTIRFAPRGRFGFLPWSDPAVREFLERANTR
jgi:hypothetical protein